MPHSSSWDLAHRVHEQPQGATAEDNEAKGVSRSFAPVKTALASKQVTKKTMTLTLDDYREPK